MSVRGLRLRPMSPNDTDEVLTSSPWAYSTPTNRHFFSFHGRVEYTSDKLSVLFLETTTEVLDLCSKTYRFRITLKIRD